MTFTDAERAFVGAARVARLATADAEGRPHAVPICYAFADDRIVSPVDEKPKEREPRDLQRVRDVEANPAVALVVDRYSEDWTELGWVQIRGRAGTVTSDGDGHAAGVAALREKYDQYADHALGGRPLLWIEPRRVLSWGTLTLP